MTKIRHDPRAIQVNCFHCGQTFWIGVTPEHRTDHYKCHKEVLTPEFVRAVKAAAALGASEDALQAMVSDPSLPFETYIHDAMENYLRLPRVSADA